MIGQLEMNCLKDTLRRPVKWSDRPPSSFSAHRCIVFDLKGTPTPQLTCELSAVTFTFLIWRHFLKFTGKMENTELFLTCPSPSNAPTWCFKAVSTLPGIQLWWGNHFRGLITKQHVSKSTLCSTPNQLLSFLSVSPLVHFLFTQRKIQANRNASLQTT